MFLRAEVRIRPVRRAFWTFGVEQQFVCWLFFRSLGWVKAEDLHLSFLNHAVFALGSLSCKVARRVSSKSSSLNGLLRNATAPACMAC